ncbi:AAA family ATPase [Nocardia sp. NPDC057227]|uniref:MinD/ParA family ATP-binding protein n=1 Tax=Nocardia sp. NPDC057227 TaxID=3346056 RepID=UPI00363A3F61
MSRNDDGLPMLPPWLSESEVTQVGYEEPVQNLPSDDDAPAPRRSRFRNRAPEGERPEVGRREKRRRGWRRGDEAPAAVDEQGESEGRPERWGVGRAESSGDSGLFEPQQGGNGRDGYGAQQAEFAPGSGGAEYGTRQAEFAPENGGAGFGFPSGNGEFGFGERQTPGRGEFEAEPSPPQAADELGHRGDFAPAESPRGDDRNGRARHELAEAGPDDEALRDPRTGAVAPEESPRPTLPTRNPSVPSSAFQPLGAGASAAGGLRETSGVRERRRARPELPPPPERLPVPSNSADDELEEAAPHRDLAGFREGISALHRDAEPEVEPAPDEPLERGQIGTPDALPPRAPVAPVTGGSVPPWQGPTGNGGGPYGPAQAEQPERAPEAPAPEPDPSAYRSAPSIPVAPQQFDVPAAGPLYPPAPPHAAPTAYPTPPTGNGSATPHPAPSPQPYSTAPTNQPPVPYGTGPTNQPAISYGTGPANQPPIPYGTGPTNQPPIPYGTAPVSDPPSPYGPDSAPQQYGDPNLPQVHQQYRSEPNQPLANQVPPQYGSSPDQPPPAYGQDPNRPGPNQPPPHHIPAAQYRSDPNHPLANQAPPYGGDPNQFGPGPNQPPGNNLPYGPGPVQHQFQPGRPVNATPPNVYGSTPPPSLDDVPMRRAKKSPGSGWRKAVHHVSGGAINPGMSAEERRLQELVARIRQPVRGDYRIAVLSLKGGVGKTTTTMGLGSIFASIRGDRVIAVDANPDFGTLSQRVPLQTRSTVRDLLLDPAIQRYSDVRRHTSQGTSRLEVLASERDPAASEAFSDEEYRAVARILQRFYNIVLTDCGTGLMHSAMTGVLDTAHSLVLISSAAIDGARSAAATLDWLSLHGHDHLVRNAVVVINLPREGSPTVGVQHLREYFLSRCRAVHIIPYDGHLSEGAEIDLHRLHKNTKRAYVELAATVADDFAVFRG